jgi:hypothetical protein
MVRLPEEVTVRVWWRSSGLWAVVYVTAFVIVEGKYVPSV